MFGFDDDKLVKTIRWVLYALTIQFVICRNVCLVDPVEYVFKCIPAIYQYSMEVLYSSIDWIAPLFIIVWFVGQAGPRVKMNLSAQHHVPTNSTGPFPSTLSIQGPAKKYCLTQSGREES